MKTYVYTRVAQKLKMFENHCSRGESELIFKNFQILGHPSIHVDFEDIHSSH